MKTIKKILLYIFGMMFLIILFRGCIYRAMFTYKSVDDRKNYAAENPILVKFIEENTKDGEPNIYDIIDMSLSLTSKKLNFVARRNDNDPNKLIESKNAHCVGYSAFFATTCNYLLQKHNLDDWHADSKIGEIYFLGENVHKHIKGSFFKDHDFVIVENSKTKEKIAIDPALYDYFYIKKVDSN